ncbi:uncharacterized protein LOC128992724 [Macrosteles quadrilineatus]|uniref:uncharacterized protein LOC128992724 n=1 Tax=Macrosteles quadrilineatus TaxID=74068 RepID=UPI0023E0CE6E|nr:uncharacterized protein LOC128992724 [Macrosteles quadrilineatus]
MLLRTVLVCLVLGSAPLAMPAPSPQRGGFELPVQLVGFPVIIIAVRISRFVKQLSYALNPQTYRSAAGASTRQTRDIHSLGLDAPGLDVAEVEKRLVAEMGEGVCVYERVCAHYAQLAHRRKTDNHALDWEHIFSRYKTSPDSKKQFYILSVFLGDIIASPGLCHQLAKRGRSCGGDLDAED